MKINIDSYIGFISDYLNNRISVQCFEYAYMKYFLEENCKMSSEEYLILNGLFMDVESFCSDPALIDEHDIDENELQKRCKFALENLQKLKND